MTVEEIIIHRAKKRSCELGIELLNTPWWRFFKRHRLYYLIDTNNRIESYYRDKLERERRHEIINRINGTSN